MTKERKVSLKQLITQSGSKFNYRIVSQNNDYFMIEVEKKDFYPILDILRKNHISFQGSNDKLRIKLPIDFSLLKFALKTLL